MKMEVPRPLIKELIEEYFSPTATYLSNSMIVYLADRINKLGIGLLSYSEKGIVPYRRWTFDLSLLSISKEDLRLLLEILRELLEYLVTVTGDEMIICGEAATINSILRKYQIKMRLVPLKTQIGYTLEVLDFP